MQLKPSRRNVFQSIAAVITAAAVRRQAVASSNDGFPASLSDTRSQEVIGRVYLAEYGGSGVIHDIAAALGHGSGVPDSQYRQTVRMLLCSRVTQDFAEGRTVLIGGWMLSCTEAQVCALAALRAAESGDW
jgi:hypothetical protein